MYLKKYILLLTILFSSFICFFSETDTEDSIVNECNLYYHYSSSNHSSFFEFSIMIRLEYTVDDIDYENVNESLLEEESTY